MNKNQQIYVPEKIKLITFLLLAFVLFQSCETVVYTKRTQIEIVVPPKLKFPTFYNNIAIRYNNINVNYNPNFAFYAEGNTIKDDPYNTDSLASIVYFNSFIENMQNQILFDSISVLQPGNYKDIIVDRRLDFPDSSGNRDNSTVSNNDYPLKPVWYLSNLLRLVESDIINYEKSIQLNPKLGLYDQEDIKKIKDSTNADVLFSLDFFTSFNKVYYSKYAGAVEAIYFQPFWNIYDLQSEKIIYFYFKEDTLYWENRKAVDLESALKKLPPRKDATVNSAYFAGEEFAQSIAPHWLKVERIYYRSGNKELKAAVKLLKQNKWLEAAQIWKKNTKNKNKNIAAKSMFNLGLACEMNGQFDAAIDWISKSKVAAKNKNPIHSENCTNYLAILNQRKRDIQSLEIQLKPYEE